MDSDMLLKQWGFNKNPFNVNAAEDEQDLPRFFVEPPYFRDIIGDISAPQSSIVFGHRGEGKSAIFDMIKYELQQIDSRRPLIVPYEDFSSWTENKIRGILLDDHIEKILGLGVDSFMNELEKEKWRLDSLNPNDRNFLQWFILKFLPAAEYHQAEQKLVSLLDSEDETNRIIRRGRWLFRRVKSYLRRKRIEVESISDRESPATQIVKAIMIFISPQVPDLEILSRETMIGLLKKFRDLVLRAGFSSIYILVDKVDESNVCNGRYDLAAGLISPIITDLPFMKIDKAAIKLFLSIQIEELLGTRIRTDKIQTRKISWSNERLNFMLKKRLLFYSNNKIETLEAFVDPTIWEEFNKNVLYYSAMSPRNLIRILDLIIAELCVIEQNPSIINKNALDLGISHFLSVRSREDDFKAYQNRLR